MENPGLRIPGLTLNKHPHHCGILYTQAGADAMERTDTVGIDWTACRGFVARAGLPKGSEMWRQMGPQSLKIRPNTSDWMVLKQVRCGTLSCCEQAHWPCRADVS
jgi:hypothetical protein